MRVGVVWRWWGGIAAGLILAAGVLVAFRGRFDYAFELIDIPAIAFAVGLGLTGLMVLPLPWLIRQSAALEARDARRLLAFVVVVGFALRAILFVTEPVLEDDYYRYLWDGGVTAHGHNPFALAPASALEQGEETAVGRLAIAAGVVMERINHPDLKTIYPPVAQAAFALAHVIAPWSVQAWRLVCLAGEAATLALLLALLKAAGRDPLWATLYWWNPLIIKEMINSAHMEAILLPLILGALLLGVRKRSLVAVGLLGLAAGAKLWPILLAPLLLRPLLERPRMLALAAALLAVMMLAWAIPPWLGGIDETSGFVAFAQNWQTNSALFLVVVRIADAAVAILHVPAERAALLARGGLGLIVAAMALWQARTPCTDASALMRKAGVVAAALFLLSPAQFPWYAAWMIPFLAFRPSLALLALTALLPVYYASFHFLARDQYDVFRHGLVWLIWLPVWAALGFEAWRARGRAETPHA
jgi:alpha-1,6-mannosyltransferase